MPTNYYLFRYLAIDNQGQLQTGHLLALSQQQLLANLQQLQWGLIHYQRRAYFPRYYWRTREKLVFLQQLAHYLQAGVPLLQSLTLLAEQQSRQGWRYLFSQLAARINNGERFSTILADYPTIFPAIYASLFYVGEETGRLDQCCQQLLQQQTQVYQLHQQIKQALRYPLLLLISALLIFMLLLGFVVPQFADMYAQSQQTLPTITQWLLISADHLQQYGGRYALLLTMLFVGYFWSKTTYPALVRAEQTVLLHLPIVQRLVNQQALQQIFLTLAIGQQAGLTTRQNFTCAQQNCHYWRYQQALAQLIGQVEQGQTLSQAIANQRCFPPICQQLIQLGEQTGQLEPLFRQLADYYQQQIQQLSHSLPQLLEPLLLMLIASLISLMLLALYLPLFSLGDLISHF